MTRKKIKLSELVEEFSLRAKSITYDGELSFYGVSNEHGITNSKYAAEDKAEEYKIIEDGCFAYNPYRINVGSIGYYKSKNKGLISPAYVVFKVKPNKIIPELLLKFLKSSEGLRQIKIFARGTVRQALRFDDLCKIEITIPSYDNQLKVFEKVTLAQQFEDLIANHFYDQLELVKNIRQQILQEAIEGKLVPQQPNEEPAAKLIERIKKEKDKLINDKIIRQGKLQTAEHQEGLSFSIPHSWQWCQLDEICKNITDGTHQTPIYTNSGRPFLSAQNIKPFRFMPEEHRTVSESLYLEIIKNRKPELGDLLIARVGAGIGETAVIDQDFDFCFYVSLGLVQPFKEYICSDYLAIVLNSPYGVKYAKGNISSKGGSAGNFNLGRIRSFPIPLPPLKEQKRITAKVKELTKLTNELEANILLCRQQNNQILQQFLKESL